MPRPTRPAAILALVCAVGCAGSPETPPPLTPPEARFATRHRSGSVLSGDQRDAGAATLDPAHTREVRLVVHYLRAVPGDAWTPLSQRTRLVIAGQGSEPLVPVTDIASAALVGTGPDSAALAATWSTRPHDAVEMHSARGLFHPGVTAVFEARGAAPTVEDRFKHVAVLVSAGERGAPATVALRIDDLRAAATPELDRRQLVVLADRPELGGEPLVLVFPSPYGDQGAFLAQLSITSDAASDSLIAAARSELATSVAAAQKRTQTFDETERWRLDVATSLAAMREPDRRRGALVYLAETAGAPLTAELALCASDETLAALLARLETPDAAGTRDEPANLAAFGWQLERQAYRLLAERLDADEISPEMRAVLTRHAGEAGRFPGMLPPLLRRAKGVAEFESLLVRENEGFLMDMSPAARVRACDWLRARGVEVPDYDPLAGRRARSAALLAATAQREAAAASRATSRRETPPPGGGRR